MVSGLKRLLDRIGNIKRTYSYKKKETECNYLPIIHGFEISSVCNLKCLYCAREQVKKRGMSHMDPEMFRLTVDKYYDQLKKQNVVHLFHHGESLVHPRIHEILDIATQYNDIHWRMITNGTIMDAELAKKLHEVCDTFCFSFDAPSKEYFEKYRVGAKYDKVVENVMFFWIWGEKLELAGKKRAQIEFNIVKTDEISIEELKEYIRKWHKWVDIIHITQLSDWGGRKDLEGIGVSKKQAFRCGSPWGEIYVMSNGQVYPCCTWEEDKEGFGNAFADDIELIWNSEKYKAFRERHIEGKFDKSDMCLTCTKPWAGGVDVQSKAPTILGRRFMTFSYLLGRVKRAFGRRAKKTKDWKWNCTVYWETDEGQIENPEFLNDA